MHCLQRRCPGGQRIAVIAQLVEQVALYRLTCRSDIDLENPGGVLAEDLVLHLGRQLRVMVLGPHAFGERAVLKLVYAALIRAAERCRISEFEQRQLKAIRDEIDKDFTARYAPAAGVM